MTVLVDLTEFFQRPHRTGIQRVGAELCMGLAGRRPDVEPVILGADGNFRRIGSQALTLMADYFRAEAGQSLEVAQNLRSIGEASRRSRDVSLPSTDDVVVVPEVFFDEERIRFYEALLASPIPVGFVIFDLLPITRPSLFPSGSDKVFLTYLKLVARCGSLAFISASTAGEFAERFGMDRRNHTVLPLGSNSLSKARPTTKECPERPTFVVLGTLEPRKNHLVILRCFKQIWRDHPQVQLCFVGRRGWLDDGALAEIEAARQRQAGFQWLPDADDRAVIELLSRASASIFVSEAEGYGLPPLESLWCGTPCIASASSPSLEHAHGLGLDVLDNISEQDLAQAVRRYFDTAYAQKKAQEALSAALPTWETFADLSAAWISRLPTECARDPEHIASFRATRTRTSFVARAGSGIRPAARWLKRKVAGFLGSDGS